ncbi:hypothetical protein BADO_1496 [Bifidobacterium adolescentis]|nr:hypothetical protein BADO_1496 [Bifidobacterium adolescentis]
MTAHGMSRYRTASQGTDVIAISPGVRPDVTESDLKGWKERNDGKCTHDGLDSSAVGGHRLRSGTTAGIQGHQKHLHAHQTGQNQSP